MTNILSTENGDCLGNLTEADNQLHVAAGGGQQNPVKSSVFGDHSSQQLRLNPPKLKLKRPTALLLAKIARFERWNQHRA